MNGTGRRVSYLLVGLAIAGLAACGDGYSGTGPGDRVDNTDYEASEDFSTSVPVTTQNLFTLRGINGNVVISGSATASEVTISGTKTVRSESVEDAEDYLSNLDVNITTIATTVGAETVQPSDTGGRTLVVDYEITVPATMRVDVVNTNGNVYVELIAANASVVNANGNVELNDITGNVSVTLTNGNIEIDNLLGSGTAVTANGNVVVDAVLPLDGSLSLQTVNGNAVLSIPQNTSADVSAGLANGQISFSNLTFANLVQTATSLTGTLGAGEGTIELQTVNGDISLTGL